MTRRGDADALSALPIDHATKRKPRNTLGYARFNCRACGRRFNERTGTPFNDLHYPTDIVLRAMLWRLRYKLSFRDVAELLLERGDAVTHETIRDWEFRFAPPLTDRLRAKRLGRDADVPKVHAHRFRHTFATWAIAHDARELDVQHLLGHSSPDMVRRCSATYRSAQAAERHAAFSPGDQVLAGPR